MDPLHHDKPSASRARARRQIRAGAMLLIISLIILFGPALLGPGPLNNIMIALGFLGTCVALSLVLHGLWDLRRAR